MALELRKTAENTSKAAGGLRETIQDLLIPEFRANKATSEAQTQELRLRIEHVTEELRLRSDKLEEELKLREATIREELRMLREELRLRDANLREELRMHREVYTATADRVSHEVKVLADKLDIALEVRERLSALEARLPRTQ